ncbi:acylphosphatase [Hydrogenothermus marinus]|uniref:acylphosphatase n=1 Tax=Hydrogenothermus marinus TaxID=133270 RepID=A0A3M0B871_9AQUI|nr:acylphosphatase [Hydrogenothermus marinus]RMA93337.1 acylphosphatase [Hydrogenothermus marinus]
MLLHAIVKGKVQGVYYRKFTKETADRLGLKGWVKNLPDGTVEVVAEGDEDKLKELLENLYKGPPLAEIIDIDYEFLNKDGGFTDFEIRY